MVSSGKTVFKSEGEIKNITIRLNITIYNSLPLDVLYKKC